MSMLVSSATTVAGRLEETRRMRGLTTREIAALIGVSQGTVSRWERGLGEPTITQFALWAEATKQPLGAMTEGLAWCARRDSNSQPSDP
jgi:transcriptional regulator with XRE-family HTH domain